MTERQAELLLDRLAGVIADHVETLREQAEGLRAEADTIDDNVDYYEDLRKRLGDIDAGELRELREDGVISAREHIAFEGALDLLTTLGE